jgi:hypothetical protein
VLLSARNQFEYLGKVNLESEHFFGIVDAQISVSDAFAFSASINAQSAALSKIGPA